MDTSEVIVQPDRTNRDIAIVGAAAGMTAGLAMATWAALTSVWHGVGLAASFEVIGATFGGHDATGAGFFSAVYGLGVHVVTAAALGILFTALLPPRVTCRYARWAGLAFAFAVLLGMTFVVTPVVNPVLRDAVDAIPRSWLIQHVLFGLTLGVVPAYWRYYQDESVRARVAQASRRALVVRRPQLPAPQPMASYPRIKRARVTLTRQDVLGTAREGLPRTPSQAAS